MDIYEVFNKFRLDLIPNEWVKEIWNNQFSELVELPPEYEEHLENVPIRQLLNEACAGVKLWLSSIDLIDNSEITTSPSKLSHTTMCRSRISEAHSVLYKSRISDVHQSTLGKSCSSSSTFSATAMSTISIGTKSWQTLISNNVQHKPLMCLLSNLIHQGRASPEDENLRQVSLGATNLYFILLAIPGSKVYNVFNPVFYAHAIESLKTCTLLNESQPKPIVNRNRRNRANNSGEDSNSEDEGRPTNRDSISGSGKINLTKSLNVLLNDILFSLERFKLQGQEDSLVLTIQILVLMTRLEKKVSNFLIHSPTQISVASLSRNAYIVLKNLCEPDHGEVEDTVRLIMKELFPGLLVLDQRGSLITAREASVIKDHSIYFIKSLLLSLNELAYRGTLTLIQHLCLRVPDRADPRSRAVQVVYEVMNVMPQNLYSKVVLWTMQLCHNDEVKNRIFGLELLTKLLSSAEKQHNTSQLQNSCIEGNEHNLYSKYNKVCNFKFMLAAVFARCNDVSSRVRAKALSIVANTIAQNSPTKREIDSIFVLPYLNVDSVEDCEVFEKEIFDMRIFLQNFDDCGNYDIDPLPGAKAVFGLLETCVDDDKVFVRKSALQVLANIFLFSGKWMTERLLELMVTSCRDISVSVRKMLVQCLTELLERYPQHATLPTYWVRGVVPLLADQELKSQEKVLEVLELVLLKNMVQFGQMRTPSHYMPWKILDVIEELKMQRLFNFACHKWIVGNIVKQSLIHCIETHIGTKNNSAAWFILSILSEYMNIKDPKFVLDYFHEHVLDAPEVENYCCQLVVETLFLNWRQLSEASQIDVCSEMLTALNRFVVPLPLISRYIDMCNVITEHVAKSVEANEKCNAESIARSRVQEWAGKLIDSSVKYLERYIGDHAPTEIAAEDEDVLCQYIYTLGDALQICPGRNVRALNLLVNLLESSECGSSEVVEEGNTRWRGKVAPRVSGVAVVTLGKMSLQKENVAKSLVPLFGKLLSHRSKAEIKINTMVALTDLCTKYTTVVEKLLPKMCVCMRDEDLHVRENTLTLLIQLIQEDYLKLRCPIFFHLLYMLQDEHSSIRDMVSVFLVTSLLVKQKNIMSQHFVESLFHYNVYTTHAVYSKNLMSPEEREVFSLDGAENIEKRREIYRYMLEHMLDDHRFKATYNICTDILAGVADAQIDLDRSGTALLKDALHVLSSNEIRMSHMQAGGSKDQEEEGGEADEEFNMVQVISNLARKTLISQMVKKNLIENIVPIIIRLKHKLKQLKSPLVKDLMAYLRELMKDYKTEINEILAADKELAAEVALDLEGTEESSEEESGDDLEKAVTKSGVILKQLMVQAVVQLERISSRSIARLSSSDEGLRAMTPHSETGTEVQRPLTPHSEASTEASSAGTDLQQEPETTGQDEPMPLIRNATDKRSR